ncbi:MAG: tRNA-dihydrouridine synthase family protein [Victivallaceae bacterium]|nr:tRNA-dihydrouridine synthase family protein [Victivallaceae bacterium]
MPYRRSARRWGCKFAFTEMVDVASIAHCPERARKSLIRCDSENFLGVQLVGSDVEWLETSIKFLRDFKFEVLDLNLGCPVPKVTKKGAGSALLDTPDLAVRMAERAVDLSPFPVTAKMRLVSGGDMEQSVALAVRLRDGGICGITVHGRTAAEFYSGDVDADAIKSISEATRLPVVANGGIHDAVSAEHLRMASGCSRIMVAQGAMGNPWIFRMIEEPDFRPTLDEWKTECFTHVSEMVELYGEDSAIKMARKIVHDYLRGRGFGGAARDAASSLSRLSDLEKLLSSARPEGAGSPTRMLRI